MSPMPDIDSLRKAIKVSVCVSLFIETSDEGTSTCFLTSWKTFSFQLELCATCA